MSTVIEFEILEDGKVSVTTDKISDTHHLDADQLLEELESILGGVKTTKENPILKQFWKNRQVLRGGKIVFQK